ncbi:MAG: restriction endonuclease subunit M [bacterium]|nr:MAG: restriction endonuclease subunit M [bacterium]
MIQRLMNTLYYGDNLEVLKRHIKDETVDLIYLDPPFNSKADYNILYNEPSGMPSKAQITAFEDTWHWTEETENTLQEIISNSPPEVIEMILALKKFIGLNDMMAYLVMMCIRLLELKRVLKPAGSIYLHCDPTASHYLKIILDTIFGKKNFRNEVVWCYKRYTAAANRYQRLHDIILFYSKSNKMKFNQLRKEYGGKSGKLDSHYKQAEDGRWYRWQKRKGKEPYKIYLSEGVRLGDWWDIPIINASAKERLGYPTQKPEALLDRIIKVSSNEGDVVLDPFCGCGTAVTVAENLKRNWIGIDITHLAINLIKRRMKDTHNIAPKKDYKIVGEPEDLSGAIELASHNRFQFQWWALSLIDCSKPYKEKKKGADTGIDGYIYHGEQREVKKVIIQVKSGKVGAKDIRELCHVVDREEATIGVFITLEKPTKPMVKEAVAKGFYKPKETRRKYLKIQILTIEDILNGKQPDMPLPISPFRKAQEADKQETIDF